MRTKIYTGILFILISVLSIQTTKAVDFLKVGFKNPPPAAKARTWWHWINGNVTRAGITADLEAMKSIGIQEAQLFNVSLGEPKGIATYLSKDWLDVFQFAATEAQRLGLELTFHNSPGWSSSGSACITPEYAMKKLVFSELTIVGGKKVEVQLPQPEMKLNFYKDIAVLAFPKPKGSDRINDLDIKTLDGRWRNHLAPDDKPVSIQSTISKSDIIDLTDLLNETGSLNWNTPEGEWTIIRFGYTPIGTTNKHPSHGGKGLECDKMSKQAVDVFWQGAVSPIIEKLDTLIGTVVKSCLIDSYEVGTSNWTSGFKEEFYRLRRYDCLEYLPTLAGYYVESSEISERFLWDFRRTVGDLMAENYYGHFRDLCHKHKLNFSIEPYWGPFDNMQVGATGDMVMCEFWSGNLAFFDSPKFVASIAKLNGNSIVGSESFTGMGGWQQHPAMLKSIGDLAWAQGINRFIFHTYVHQPWNIAPGLTLGPFGIDFNRHNTWWNQGKGFLDYIARSQFLLQQGSSVADVLIFTGEASPNDALLMPEIKTLGFDYDLIGANKLAVLSVKDGLIQTPNGDKYKTLFLPETKWLTPETLQVIKNLANSGAIVLGAKPLKSPSLKNYPQCDQEVAELANELWENGLIKNESIIDNLKNSSLLPDFKIENSFANDFGFIHRKTKDSDIYFIANPQKEARDVTVTFRISGKQPELWNAETGNITKATVWKDNKDGTTSVPIQFKAEDAIFVIFSEPVNTEDQIVKANIKLKPQENKPPNNLQIIKAEYGTFLPQGLVDVTEVLSKSIKNNTLQINADRTLCNCDPAPGYNKELRVVYSIDDKIHQTIAMERELLKIASKGKLKIKKAIFGKFVRGLQGIPEKANTIDITDSITNQIQSGVYNFKFEDKSFRIIYKADGVVHEKLLEPGGILNLASNKTKSKIVYEGKTLKWITPSAGELYYQTASGKSKRIHVKTIPKPLELNNGWEVKFPIAQNDTINAKFDQLISWSVSQHSNIRYYSGTAIYKKEFLLTKQLLNNKTLLELDLGNVEIIAEVIVNGKNLGILWKTPFKIMLDNHVNVGKNTLEIKVTNRWTNRLIGDEQLPNDIIRKGAKVKEWPKWLKNYENRDSDRSTFSAYKHYRNNDELQSSGLIGSVKIIPYVVKSIK